MIVIQTPLRVSFLGGSTDIEDFYRDNGGAVLSTAIDKSVFVIVKERFDDKIYLNWAKKEIVDRVDDIEHELIREAMRMAGVSKGVEITTLSDIPSEGSGLGSSSSITVGLLHALYTYQGRLVTSEELAQQACEIEINILGKPIGKQDQYIASYGNMRFIEFQDSGVSIENVRLSNKAKRRLNESLLLFYTGTTRQAVGILTEQKANIKDRLSVLKGMAKQTYEARSLLEGGGFDKFGELLDEGWLFKKQLASRITNSEIDEIYQSAKEAGALGGKLLGAGGGGFMLLYCPADKRDSVRARLVHLRELPFQFAGDGSKVIFDYRR